MGTIDEKAVPTSVLYSSDFDEHLISTLTNSWNKVNRDDLAPVQYIGFSSSVPVSSLLLSWWQFLLLSSSLERVLTHSYQN